MEKKLMIFSFLIILIALFSGCMMQDESQSDTSTNEISDFYGNWVESSGQGSL